MVLGGQANDFGDLDLPTVNLSQAESSDGKDGKPAKGKKRNYLMAFETVPAQMLNVYGKATFPDMTDADVWKHLNEPLRSGGIYMTEYCSQDPERRGVGFNRFCLCMVNWIKHNMSDVVQGHNKKILNEKLLADLNEEMKGLLPALEYCLAPKKEYTKKAGASSLRSGSITSLVQATSTRENEQLNKYAEQIYGWLDTEKKSFIRLLMNWQAAGGLSFVACTHHRATQCFRYCGNAEHDETKKEVSLEEFQTCVRARHAIGSNGMERDTGVAADFR